MYFVKSTTQKAYTVEGKLIPRCVTNDNSYLELTDSEWAHISSIPVIASLIKAGGILFTTKRPQDMNTSLESLKGSNALLIAKNTELEEELKRKELELSIAKQSAGADIDIEAIKQEAVEEIKKEAVEELQLKQKDLDESQQKLADAQKEIEKLRKQLEDKE